MSFVSSRRSSFERAGQNDQGDHRTALRRDVQVDLPTDFVWIAAHQLRTRLSVLAAGLDEAGRLSRQRLSRHVDQMRRLLDQLLVVALSENDLSAELRPLDLNALVADVVRHFGPMAQSKGCCLHVECWEGPVIVRAHYDLSFEALSNLIDNAIKYGGREPYITVRVCPFNTVSVIDNGPGVPPALRPRLFVSHGFEAKGSRAGAGLGLFIVGRIMAAQAGSISYEVAVPHGSQFIMRFGGT